MKTQKIYSIDYSGLTGITEVIVELYEETNGLTKRTDMFHIPVEGNYSESFAHLEYVVNQKLLEAGVSVEPIPKPETEFSPGLEKINLPTVLPPLGAKELI